MTACLMVVQLYQFKLADDLVKSKENRSGMQHVSGVIENTLGHIGPATEAPTAPLMLPSIYTHPQVH